MELQEVPSLDSQSSDVAYAQISSACTSGCNDTPTRYLFISFHYWSDYIFYIVYLFLDNIGVYPYI